MGVGEYNNDYYTNTEQSTDKDVSMLCVIHRILKRGNSNLGHFCWNIFLNMDKDKYLRHQKRPIVLKGADDSYPIFKWVAVTWLKKTWQNECSPSIDHQGPLLLTWFNFNPSMDK